MNYTEIKDMRDEFNELCKDARQLLIDKIVQHFEGDNWTMEELEDLWDAQIYDNTSMSSEEEMAYTDAETSRSNGFVSLNKATDSKEIRNLLETDLEYDYGTLLLFATKYIPHEKLSDITIPYSIVILDSEKAPIRDWDEAERELADTDETPVENIKEYIVCQGKEELIEKWKENLKKYEGEWYSVSDPATMIVGGAYDPNDMEYLETVYDDKRADYVKMARTLIDSVEKGMCGYGHFISDDPKISEAYLIAKKDPSLEGIYELWVKTNCNIDPPNGGEIIGKIYDLCGTEELADALKNIDDGTALLTVKGERKNIKEVLTECNKEKEISER